MPVIGAGHLGDVYLGETHYFEFNTVDVTGAPIAFATATPTLAAYVNGSTTQITAGLTLAQALDGVVGLHGVTMVLTSGNGYAAASDISITLESAATVDGVVVLGKKVASFSIQNRSALRPATAGRQAVVDANGLIDANTVKVGPTGSGTAQTAGDLAGKIGTPVALDGAAATLGGMLTNLADDNGGATFDATNDSLNKLKGSLWDQSQSAHTAAGSFGGAAERAVVGLAVTGTLSVTQASTNLAGYAVGSLIGRVITWGGATVIGQAAVITAYDGAGLVTWAPALTAAPLNGDDFTIRGGPVQTQVLGTQAKADVNAEVVDALATDTYAEPSQEAPAATNTLAKKIGYLFKAWRNKSTQTATTYSLYADDAVTVDQKATTGDDATTFTKGEVGTGP